MQSGSSQPVIDVIHVGTEKEPVVVIDGFQPDPGALRQAALHERFVAATNHYPGVRAPLPGTYFQSVSEVLSQTLERAFGHRGRVDVIDASFSIVSTPPKDLTVRQRLPHCDAFEPGRIALVHYLGPENGPGTAFFRHRSTGFEKIDERRAPEYFAKLDAELQGGADLPARYISDDTELFERTEIVEARVNRAVLYRSYLLHSGAISSNTILSADPEIGRLTVTGFLSAT